MLAFLIATAAAAELPSWTRGQTLERHGYQLRVVCMATAPSLDMAREQANNACRSEAVRQVQTNVSIRAESIESDHDAVFHQQIKTFTRYEGLDCKPENEAILPGPDQTTVYLKCSYDLSKVRATEIKDPELPVVMVKDRETLSDEVPQVIQDTSDHGFKKDSSRHIILSSVPGACDTVIVHGSGIPRIVKCTDNPQLLTVDTKTVKLVVRPKAKGYLPKVIPLKGELPETLEVQYEQQ